MRFAVSIICAFFITLIGAVFFGTPEWAVYVQVTILSYLIDQDRKKKD